VFRGPKLPKTHCELIMGAIIVERRDIMPTDAPIHTPVLVRLLLLHLPLPLPMDPTLFLLLPSKTAHGRINHVTVEEAQEAPDIVIGMFLVNDTSVVVLFDSGASHSFIFASYVEKHNLPLALLKCQMIISSMGGDMPARQLCPKVDLKIRGVEKPSAQFLGFIVISH
jgi:hypothetical protein